MSKYLIPGLRTPFVKANGAYADHDSIALSIPVIQAMAERAHPDLLVWGQVIPSPTVSNIGRELALEAGLPAETPAFSTVMACSTSMMAAIQAAALVGQSDLHLALVGGVETMTHAPIALKPRQALRLREVLRKDPTSALAALAGLGPGSFDLPARGWANRISGRSMGEHTEDTIRHFAISRDAQDAFAHVSHQKASAAQDAGFFDDLLISFAGLHHDALVRRDSSQERLAALKPAFARAAEGTITAGNASPLTDGAAGLWVADETGWRALTGAPAARLVDWQLAAMDWSVEGLLMAPARAIPRLLARQGLRFDDIAVWELHEAFAGQVLANVQAFSDPAYRRAQAGVDADLGTFPWERLNPNGGSLAIGHPFAATGARIISQAVKELAAHGPAARAIVSICADGGQGSVLLLEAA